MRGEDAEPVLTIDDGGRLRGLNLPRWANVDNAKFSYVDFGGIVEEEATFDGLTIPVRLRIGYFVGTPKFESDGEFIRITIDDVTFR